MNHGLLTYEDARKALLPLKVAVRSLRRYASTATPVCRRLKVVRMSHTKVGIRPADLEIWKARCAGEQI